MPTFCGLFTGSSSHAHNMQQSVRQSSQSPGNGNAELCLLRQPVLSTPVKTPCTVMLNIMIHSYQGWCSAQYKTAIEYNMRWDEIGKARYSPRLKEIYLDLARDEERLIRTWEDWNQITKMFGLVPTSTILGPVRTIKLNRHREFLVLSDSLTPVTLKTATPSPSPLSVPSA